MAIAVDAGARSTRRPATRSVRLAGRVVPIVGPSIRDPRIHLSITILTIITIGMVWLDFRLSIPQVAVALVCVRPARARPHVPGQAECSSGRRARSRRPPARRSSCGSPAWRAHDWWSFDGWYYFVGVGVQRACSPSTSSATRDTTSSTPRTWRWWRRSSCSVPTGSNRSTSGGRRSAGRCCAAYVVIFVGGIGICRRLRLIEMGVRLLRAFAVGVGVLALLGQRSPRMVVDAGQRHALLVDPGHLAGDVHLPVLHDHRPPTARRGRSARVVFGCAWA